MYSGGVIIETKLKRVYPYGSLARRTIGFVRNNNELYNNHIGIEGSFNKALSSKDGYEVIMDKHVRLHFGKGQAHPENHREGGAGKRRERKVNDGYQDAGSGDSLLRSAIIDREEIKDACLMTVSTNSGAIRTMVNLTRDFQGEIGEYYNVSIGYGYELGRIIYEYQSNSYGTITNQPY